MKKICKTLLVFIFLNSINVLIYGDKLFFLNYDAQSSAMGNSIASFSNNSFSCINSPSTNFKFLSKRMDFSFVSLPSDMYVGAYAISMPFSFGNVTLASSYSKYSSKNVYINQDDDYLKDASALYLNYALPIFKTCPVYDNIGGVGITIKGSKLNFDGISKSMYSCDFGSHYKLHMIDDGFFVVMCVRNLGNNRLDLKNQDLIDGLENFDFALRYNFKGTSNFALVADMIKFFDNSNVGYTCGAEISPIYPATFKLGYTDYNDGYLKGVTTGIFLNFNSFNLGYAFSGINNKDTKHTINMGFMFGSIEDDNKAYKYYLGVNFIRAKEAYDKKDFINASQMFQNILAVYPNHVPSKEYLQKIIYELDVQKKDIELSINKFLRKAQKAYETNNLIKARIYYKEVLGLDSANAQALDGISEINRRLKEIDSDENKEINAKKIVSLWKEGVKFYNEKNFVFAKEKFKEIISIDFKNSGAIKYLNLIATQLSNITSVQSRIVFEQGMQYYNEKNYKEAAKYFSAAYVTDPNMAEAKKYYILSKKALKQRYDDIDLFKRDSLNLMAEDGQDLLQKQKDASDYYNKALHLIKKNELESAFVYLDKAYRYIQEEYIAEAKNRLALRLSEKYYNQGLKAYNLKQNKKAVSLLEKASFYDKNNKKVIELLDKINKRDSNV
jgi:tetratricopeptide (TPR) repeat protein